MCSVPSDGNNGRCDCKSRDETLEQSLDLGGMRYVVNLDCLMQGTKGELAAKIRGFQKCMGESVGIPNEEIWGYSKGSTHDWSIESSTSTPPFLRTSKLDTGLSMVRKAIGTYPVACCDKTKHICNYACRVSRSFSEATAS